MNWLAALGVGLCSAPLTGVICGTAALLCADWTRIPQREGAAGFFVVGMALLGAFLGLVLGIGFARGWFVASPGFLKAFGLTLATCTAGSALITGLVWLAADLKPKIDGRELELAFELRYPVDAPPDSAEALARSHVTFVRLSDGDSRGRGELSSDAAREDDGRRIVPGTLEIDTSAAKKLLNIRLGDERNLLFTLDFGAKPKTKDFEWSGWIDAAYELGQQPPPSDRRFAVRYRVRLVEPPPPAPTSEEVQAAADAQQEAELRALGPDAPLAQWLVYTRYGVPQLRIDATVSAMRARPTFAADMAHEMLAGEYESSRDALRALEHMHPPPTELAAAVAQVGAEIAQALHDPSPQYADISTRFSAWMVATRALQGTAGVDFVPQLEAIIEPARTHQHNHVVRIDVVRVASYYLQQWGGIEPLPTDPPPR
jgi:hypothetical protein